MLPKKKWTLLPPPEKEALQQLSQELSTVKNPFFLQLLLSRGIKSFDQAKAFMLPEISLIHDPFLMKDMDKAVERLGLALETGEKILIYGDYDVDGTTSVALVYGYLSEILGADCDYYIPDRYTEGYGVSQAGVQYAKDNDYSLIISLDCGIKAHERVAWCNEQGIDFIVCDHHLPEEQLPEALAVLDPKRKDCPYPFKELTGCGVGFKLLQAFIEANFLEPEPLWERIDLLACSIAADMVPITGENRIFTYFGLEKLSNNASPGLAFLLQNAGRTAPIQVTDIVFSISPVINAAGRMDHAHGAVKLLLASDKLEASQLAEAVLKQNQSRKEVEKEIVQQALEIFQQDSFLPTAFSTVLFHPSWHKGVVGIVASKIQEHYYRPTIILTESNGHLVGSARSVKGFDIHAALESCADLLVQFGGHTHAAGLHLKPEDLPAFIQRFDELVKKGLTENPPQAELLIDMEVPLSALNLAFHDKLLIRLSPFGPGNMIPLFQSNQLFQTAPPTIMKEAHLKLFVQDKPENPVMEVIAFNLRADFYEGLMDAYLNQKPISLVYHLEVNEFRGNRKLQLRALDMA